MVGFIYDASSRLSYFYRSHFGMFTNYRTLTTILVKVAWCIWRHEN